jgi:hypothetical protein
VKDLWWNDNNCSGALPTEKIYDCSYLASAEPREKRIEELEAVNKRISDECHKLVDSLEKKQKEIAELKADRPQWHILAEETDVLPKEGQKLRVLTEEGDIENSTYFYDTYYEEFAFSNIGLLKVFAWCENPTFDKE